MTTEGNLAFHARREYRISKQKIKNAQDEVVGMFFYLQNSDLSGAPDNLNSALQVFPSGWQTPEISREGRPSKAFLYFRTSEGQLAYFAKRKKRDKVTHKDTEKEYQAENFLAPELTRWEVISKVVSSEEFQGVIRAAGFSGALYEAPLGALVLKVGEEFQKWMIWRYYSTMERDVLALITNDLIQDIEELLIAAGIDPVDFEQHVFVDEDKWMYFIDFERFQIDGINS